LKPTEEALPSLDMMRIYEEGHTQEGIVIKELEEAGYQLKKVDRMVDDKLELTGEIERMIKLNGNIYPLDIKSCSTQMFNRIKQFDTGEEMLNSDFIWLRHYPVQMQLYLLLYKYGKGILFFKDKDKGRKHPIHVDFDVHFTEEVINGLEVVNKYVERKELPKINFCDACKSCGFYNYDFPDTDFAKEDVKRITDADAENMLMRREELKPLAKEYDDIDENIKLKYKGANVVVGDYRIYSKPYQATVYDVPDYVKKQYKNKQVRFRMNIKNLMRSL